MGVNERIEAGRGGDEPSAARSAWEGERQMVEALRRGDEAVFAGLVDRYHDLMVRVARDYVRDRSVAEEVAQDAWLGVIRGLDRFEGRSSLRTWIFRILANTAKTRAERERRTVPFSMFADPDAEAGEPAVSPDRFLPADHRWAGHWAAFPCTWGGEPEERLLSAEADGVVRRAIDGLPSAQRLVITMRDVEGWGAEEVCQALSLSAGNQRVLLHRARSRVRAALERYMDG